MSEIPAKTIRRAIKESCPFCGGDTYSHTIDRENRKHSITCTTCWASTGNYDTWEEAVEAWDARATQPEEENKPLSLEELREMDGGEL